MMRLITTICCLMFLYGCSFKGPTNQEKLTLIEPNLQNISLFSPQMNYELTKQNELAKNYQERYFKIWDQPPSNNTDLFSWIIDTSRNKPGFGENLLPNSTQWIEELIDNMQLENYPNVSKAGIIIEDTSLRLMPTDKPRFFDFKQAGQGYPFDHWQNSSIYTSTPIMISQQSRDKQWYFVQSSFASGWVPHHQIAFVSQKDQKHIKNQKWIVAFNDQTNIYDQKGFFLQKSKIGKILFLHQDKKDMYQIKIPARNAEAQLIWKISKVDKQNFSTFPLQWNQEHITQIAQSLINQKYGWGGLLQNRDCSTLTRDFFGSFGVWLERNSAAQAHDSTLGEYMTLSNEKGHENKHTEIIKNAIPWASLLWFQGHIMIYIGEHEGKAMVFHSIWGLKTLENNQEGRYILGQSLINDLYIGNNIPIINQEQLLIHRVAGIKNIFSKYQINLEDNNGNQ